jgi:hypothetical protein
MLLLNSIDHWWPHLEKHELVFTSNVFDYRGNTIDNDYYRKTFTANNLSNVYVGAFYFKKVAKAYEFFKWLDILTNNWKEFYSEFLPKAPQKFCSLDVNSALAVKFMDCESQVLVNKTFIPSFTHMKPALQGWNNVPIKWTSVLSSHFSDECQLKVGNVQQQGLFHYVENEFLTDDILHKLSRQT